MEEVIEEEEGVVVIEVGTEVEEGEGEEAFMAEVMNDERRFF